MSDAQFSPFVDSPHIRTLDVTRDLNPVADLIEMCFPIHKDRDGQTYLKQMRRAARDMYYLRWLSSMADLSGDRIAGFVWEEEGEILGNISMVPFKDDGQVIHMIANVAVRPDQRRRGIAKALTVRVIDLLRRKHEPRVWLQVRDVDEGAQALYRSVGFEDRLKRTTWRVRPVDIRNPKDSELAGVVVRKRKDTDWESQNAWLNAAYPPSMRWNLPVKFNQFEAGPFQEIKNFIDGISLKHWSIEQGGSLRGVLTWQKTTTYANNLWLALAPEADSAMVTSSLPEILQNFTRRHPLSLDLAYDSHATELTAMGFKIFRTLIWMSRELN